MYNIYVVKCNIIFVSKILIIFIIRTIFTRDKISLNTDHRKETAFIIRVFLDSTYDFTTSLYFLNNEIWPINHWIVWIFLRFLEFNLHGLHAIYFLFFGMSKRKNGALALSWLAEGSKFAQVFHPHFRVGTKYYWNEFLKGFQVSSYSWSAIWNAAHWKLNGMASMVV